MGALTLHAGVPGCRYLLDIGTMSADIKNACIFNASSRPVFVVIFLIDTANIVISFEMAKYLPFYFSL